MRRKKNLNLSISVELLNEFNRAAEVYGHKKQKNLVLSAAILQFLETDPVEQGRLLERVVSAEIRNGVAEMIEHAKSQQASRIEARERDAPSPHGRRGSRGDASGAA